MSYESWFTMVRPTLVHIGLPKTGTTSLQELLFAQHKDITYLGQTEVGTQSESDVVLRALLDPVEGPRLRPEASKIIEQRRQSEKALVISDEAITLGPFMRRAMFWDLTNGHTANATAVKDLLGDVQILIVLRNQVDWLVSWHAQGLKNGKYKEFDFDRWLNGEIGGRKDVLFKLLDYPNLIKSYQQVFGSDNVHVEFYEDYETDFPMLGTRIAAMLGVDEDIASELLRTEKRNQRSETLTKLPKPMARARDNRFIKNLLKLAPVTLKQKIRGALSFKHTVPQAPPKNTAALRTQFSTGNQKLFEYLENVVPRDGYL